MLGIMFQKMLSKKWMFLCLLLGSALLVATMVSFPLYQNAVFDRMLRDEFQSNLAKYGDWPAILFLSRQSGWFSQDEILEAEELMSGITETLGVETKENVFLYHSPQNVNLESGRTDTSLYGVGVGWMSDLAEHVTMLNGEMYSREGLAEDGSIEVVISQEFMVKRNLLVGDTLQLTALRNEDGSYKRITIKGIFKSNEDDFYWDARSWDEGGQLDNLFLMPEGAFRDIFMKNVDTSYSVLVCDYSYLFEYESLEAGMVPGLLEKIVELELDGGTCLSLMGSFQEKSNLISTTLFILQVPVLVLLGAFLLMVSRQMYELEKSEISVIKSRGSSGFQIFRLYLYQSVFLTALGVLIGLPLGSVFVRGLGSASGFLEFGLHRNLEMKYDMRVWMYLGAAAAIIILIMTLPVIGHSKVSIVNLKQGKAAKKKSWWERFFLDFVCLAVGLYGFYNYSRNQTAIMADVLVGQSLDPLLYISSALFIMGMGLLYLRLQPLIIKLFYGAGKRFWGAASHASFVESIRSSRKQQFIMLFLILTVSLGIFYATVARTILQNAQEQVEYLESVDLVVREVWQDNAAAVITAREHGAAAAFHGFSTTPKYVEPDLQKYKYLGAKAYTKVLYDDPGSDTPRGQAYFNFGDETQNLTLMGIHTREFGEITQMDRDLLEEHYYTYLNALADLPEGILVSRSFQSRGCEIGDVIRYWYASTMGTGDKTLTNEYNIKGEIVGFVDYWPGFEPTSTYIDLSGEVVTEPNYLVVANYNYLQESFGNIVEPYEIWIALEEGVGSEDITAWRKGYDVSLQKYVNRREDLRRTAEDPLLQGTNGVLTMSFLVMILLCAVGYLIYWIMSVRSRELVFGTLRAFGMHKGELFRMLIIEQVFSGVLSVFAGIGIGKLASRMYVPILQTAYASSNQVLPMHLYSNPEDMARLYGAIALVMAVCVAVLILLVFRLNMTKALKLGEE